MNVCWSVLQMMSKEISAHVKALFTSHQVTNEHCPTFVVNPKPPTAHENIRLYQWSSTRIHSKCILMLYHIWVNRTNCLHQLTQSQLLIKHGRRNYWSPCRHRLDICNWWRHRSSHESVGENTPEVSKCPHILHKPTVVWLQGDSASTKDISLHMPST